MKDKQSQQYKSTLNRRQFLVGATVVGASLGLIGCKKSSTPKATPQPGTPAFKITGFTLPAKVTFVVKTDFSFSGQGFAVGDQLIFSSQTDPSKSFTAIVKSITNNSCTFSVPDNFIAGNYRVSVSRNNNSIYLGATQVETPFANLPDKANMTIKGVVHAGGVGLANVVVSDGVEVVKTDSNGAYYLPSQKKKNFVFVSIPGGYEVEQSGPLPLFYKKHSGNAAIVEVIDFELQAVNNDKHVVLALGDMHLANRNNDVSQFQKGFLTDAPKTITKYKNEGYKVYGLTLGDMTWDAYWYDNNYSFPQYLNLVNNIGIPLFHTMGNHDNDPYVANDWSAESAFRASLGPTYYSFNLGKVHYIVLDNIQYINTGATQGTVGQREYNTKVIAEQMEWLKKDLAMISDKSTPIILAMHAHLYKQPSTSNTATLNMSNGTELLNALSEFNDVNILTAHTHICYGHEHNTKIMEHNSGAICATWWWTGKNGYSGNNTCKDGAPGGYVIWKFDNRDYTWRYKSVGFEEDYQFRAYDLNKCLITAGKYAPNATEAAFDPYKGSYGTANNNNEILVNVWGYDKAWKVEMFENGTNPLSVSRVSTLDPLHIISYEAFRVNEGKVPTEDFCSRNSTNMFKAKANSATSSILIKVTDRFGNVYSETMSRPKELTVATK